MPRHTTLTVSLFSVTLLAAALIAGPLTPPAGPVNSTYKTLSEVEPRTPINAANTPGDADSLYKITQPGSYYLTGNILGVAAKHGIEIAASSVSIDLSGFELQGVAASLNGISTTVNSLTGLCVRNGTIRSWGGLGIDFLSVNATDTRISAVTSIGNGDYGIYAGTSATITDCIAASNSGGGILTPSCGSVVSCIARNNAGQGITVFSGMVENCIAENNDGAGIVGVSGCTIRACSSKFNGGNGISVDNGCLVTHTSNVANSLNGIQAFYGNLIIQNDCRQNGDQTGDGAGILVVFDDCRVEGNTCSIADRGIEVMGARNLIIRNSCSGNTTDWVLAANNIYGPIMDRRSALTAAINGFSASSALGSTDANANYSY